MTVGHGTKQNLLVQTLPALGAGAAAFVLGFSGASSRLSWKKSPKLKGSWSDSTDILHAVDTLLGLLPMVWFH